MYIAFAQCTIPSRYCYTDCAIPCGSCYLRHYVRDRVDRGEVETETTAVDCSHQGTAY